MAAPRGAAQYSAGRELGEGTWGKVFLGTRLVDGRKVAIKRIKQNPAQADLGLSFSALRELRLMREMRHENLVSLIDVYAQDAHLHLVLEVLATDLEKVWALRYDHPPPPAATAAAAAVAAADGEPP